MVDNAGNLWVPDNLGQVEKIHKNIDGTLTTSVFITGQSPDSIAFDPVNGHIYVASSGGPLQELDTSGNILNQFTPANPNDAQQITVAKDGSIWFTTPGASANDPNQTYTSDIGRMDLSGNFSFQQIPITNTQSFTIAPASDGSVWFGTIGGDNPITQGMGFLGHGTANSSGAISLTMYNIPQPNGGITSIAVAADNSIWYGLGADGNSASQRPAITEEIGHATLTGSKLSVTEYAVPKQAGEGLIEPGTLALDNAGRLWFTTLDSIDYLDTVSGDFTRMTPPSNSGGVRNGLAISTTDVWVSYNSGSAYNLADVSLATFSPPVMATSPDISSGAGQAFLGPVAVFTSADAGSFAYTIDFGNGTTQTGTLANDPSGVYTISGSTTYATVGTYKTKVTIIAASGDAVSVNGQATITAPTVSLVSQGVNLQAQRGQALAANVSGVANVVVAQFSGPLSNYSATIHWGDGTSGRADRFAWG